MFSSFKNIFRKTKIKQNKNNQQTLNNIDNNIVIEHVLNNTIDIDEKNININTINIDEENINDVSSELVLDSNIINTDKENIDDFIDESDNTQSFLDIRNYINNYDTIEILSDNNNILNKKQFITPCYGSNNSDGLINIKYVDEYILNSILLLKKNIFLVCVNDAIGISNKNIHIENFFEVACKATDIYLKYGITNFNKKEERIKFIKIFENNYVVKHLRTNLSIDLDTANIIFKKNLTCVRIKLYASHYYKNIIGKILSMSHLEIIHLEYELTSLDNINSLIYFSEIEKYDNKKNLKIIISSDDIPKQNIYFLKNTLMLSEREGHKYTFKYTFTSKKLRHFGFYDLNFNYQTNFIYIREFNV